MYHFIGRPGGVVQVDGARCAGREEVLLQQRDPAERLGEAAGAYRLPGQHLIYLFNFFVVLHGPGRATLLWIRIRTFLDLPDPSLFVRIRILPSTSKKIRKTLICTIL
jgi:hypothetical protein